MSLCLPAWETKGAERVELGGARVMLAPGMSGPERKAAQMLVEEAQKRSHIRWPMGEQRAGGEGPVVFLGQGSALVQAYPELAEVLGGTAGGKAEGYRIVTTPERVVVAGNDARGVLYGAGRLLRLMDYKRGGLTVAAGLDLATAPAYALRGHQLGYRPMSNSYDAWDVATWEDYIRDLVIFGANAIEAIPPSAGDAANSVHFPLSQVEMMVEQSRLAKEYGIDFWVWYPALHRDYSDLATVALALKEWGDVLRQLPRVDGLFVPGGDPGSTPPKLLFPMVEKQAAQLQQIQPGAKIWLSTQGFSGEQLEDFYALLQTEPTWLEGIIYAPQVSEPLETLRARVPARYKVRLCPDITHALASQYPVPEWDYALAATHHREPIMPRPMDQAAIFRRMQPPAEHGFITYSDGANDDVNKFIWNSLGWDPEANVTEVLRDYAGYFIGTEQREGFAQGLLALERNWRGRLIANDGVYTTLAQFQELERMAAPAVLGNWRFQMALYRAYYDATIRARLIAETAQEGAALEPLRRARGLGSLAAMDAAEALLAAPAERPAAEWRARVFELAEALFQSIRMQLSVPRYRASAIRRGANLDLIDFPLNNGPWLKGKFAEIRAMEVESERLRGIDEILNWTNPGPGGFYDDLGSLAAQSHLVQSKLSYAEDPAGQRSPLIGFAPRHGGAAFRLQGMPYARVSSSQFAEALHDQPLEMHYPSLDRTAKYKLRVVYGSEAAAEVKLVANGRYEIHPMQEKDMQVTRLEYEIPEEATASGELRLTWTRPPGVGGTGRGVQVAEVWIMRVPEATAAPRGRSGATRR